MKLFIRLRVVFLCLLLAFGMHAYALAEGISIETKLQLPEESSILELSANGDSILVIYENDNMFHASIFNEKGAFVYELCQSTDALSARFLASGKLAVRHSDVLDVWDVQSNTKVRTCTMREGAIPDADGQSIWHTEMIEKNNELDILTNYVAKAVRTTADDTQSVLEMPDGVTTLLYAQYPYLYYEKEISDYKRIVCRINVITRENTEYTDWIRGTDTPMGHVSKLFRSEILMPWEQPNQMLVAHNAQMIARDGTTLLLRRDENICVIDAKRQTLLAQVPNAGRIIVGAVNEEKRCFVLADASSATVYHWIDEGTATDMAELIDLENISEVIKTQREALLSTHGITVTNDETIVAEVYKPRALNSELRSYVAGIELTNFFELMPQGLIEEMRPAALRTFPVCLTGYMTCVGLSIPYDEAYYLALDVNFLYDTFIYSDSMEDETSPMIDTLPHEFMHMLEYHLTQTTLPDGKPILSLWDAVVPTEENGTFTGTYEGDWDARNSLDSGAPADEIWFEAAYSRTMPQEDRATLFACMFSGVHETGEGWDVYPHLLEKGQLLCAIIREAYPSIKATPEKSMYWERNFEQAPFSSLDMQTNAGEGGTFSDGSSALKLV